MSNQFDDSNQNLEELIQKLQTYQAQLEAQNNELLQNQAESISQKEKYLALFTNSPMAYIIISQTGFIRNANTKFCSILDISKAKLLDKPFTSFCCPETKTEVIKAMVDLRIETEQKVIEIRLLTKHEPRWFSCTISSYINEDNELQYLANLTDIHNLKELKEKNDIMSFMVDQSHDSIIRTDVRGTIIYANKATELMYGYTEAELIGKHPSIFYTESNALEIQQAIHKEISNNRTYEGTLQNVKKSGETFWCSMKVTPLTDENSNLIGFNSIQRDITRLAIAEQKAEAASRAKSEFLGNMSHELRTPLNAIMGFNQLVADALKDDTLKDYISKSQQAAGALLNIINDMINFSNIEAGRVHPKQEPFAVLDIVESIESKYKHACCNKGLNLQFDIDHSIPAGIYGDKNLIIEALNNLFDNAVKFTKEGFVRLSVREKDKQFIEFSVKDTGKGISRPEFENLFEPFFQNESVSTKIYGGTGLGLAICHSLVTLMGGTIHVESKLDHGSEFTIKLPYVQEKQTFYKPFIRDISVLIENDNVFRFNSAYAWLESMTGSTIYFDPEESITAKLIANPDINTIITKMNSRDFQVAILNKDYAELKPRQLNVIFVNQPNAANEMGAFPEMFVQNICYAPSPTILKTVLNKITNKISSERESNKQLNKKQVHALIVEDNLLNQIVAKGILKALNITCDIANHGKEALEMIYSKENTFYDFILMDLYMPVMDGYETIEKLMTSDIYNKTPIIAVTADTQEDTKDKIKALGAAAFVEKPVTKIALKNILTEIILYN